MNFSRKQFSSDKNGFKQRHIVFISLQRKTANESAVPQVIKGICRLRNLYMVLALRS